MRADFPVFERTINGKPLTFLDTAASAQKPRQVIQAMSRMMESGYANVHRGLYTLSQEATQAFEDARATVARFLNAARPEEVVFTRSTTEAINLVANSWGRHHLQAGDEVVLTHLEHHANLVPWQMLKRALGITLRFIPIHDNGSLDMEAAERVIGPRTKLLAMTHISNALGTIVDVEHLTRLAKAQGATVLIDGSQGVIHLPVDVQALGADFYAFTGHKLYGPTGIGVLWGRYDLLESLPPWQGGGDMIDTVSYEDFTVAAPPARFEAGTPAIVEAVGLAAAIDYVEALGRPAIAEHERQLLDYAMTRLVDVEGLQVLGTAQHKAAVLSMVMDGVHVADLAMLLDKYGVATRTGHHCAMPLMDRLGVAGTARASLGLYTNRADIDRLTDALTRAGRLLRE